MDIETPLPLTSQAPPRKRGKLRRIGRLAMLVLAIYVGVVLVFAAIQDKLIFPGSETQGKPEYVVKPRPEEELVSLTTAKGDRVVALFGKALNADGTPDPKAATRPTIVDFYGNGMCLKTARSGFDDFRKLGVNVLIAEYVGYGMSGGSPSEKGCYETADAAYEYLLTRKDVDPKKIIAAGWSLGGAVAIDLASRKPVYALVSFCSFTSMADAVKTFYPLLPAKLLLKHRFESLKKIPAIRVPTFIAHGRRDTLVPARMSDRLAASAGGPVTTYWVDDADHNDFFALGGPKLLDALKRFLDQLPAEPAR